MLSADDDSMFDRLDGWRQILSIALAQNEIENPPTCSTNIYVIAF